MPAPLLPLLLFLSWLILPLCAWAEPIAEAKQLFARLEALSASFDPALADLYADEAFIQNQRLQADGTSRAITLPAPKYKEIIRSVMPTAKQRGDQDQFSEVTYVPEGSRIRIRAQRYSVLKKYTSNYSLLVGPGADGRWLIFEELSESRP